MPRPASPTLVTEVARDVTTPGYLVEIGFEYPLRMCSRDTVTFRGLVFLNWGFALAGVSPAADQSSVKGSIQILDPDRTVMTYVLSEATDNKSVKIWAYYGDVPTNTAVDLWSPIEWFNGVIGGCLIDPSKGRVTLDLVSSGSRTMYSPRLRITKANGFNWVPATGTVIDFGGERFEIESE